VVMDSVTKVAVVGEEWGVRGEKRAPKARRKVSPRGEDRREAAVRNFVRRRRAAPEPR
jgi:hypothetical protein